MSANPPTPLTPNEQTALDHLDQHTDSGGPISRDGAVEQLVDAGFVEPAAHDLIEQLLLKGYLYEGDDGIRITDPE